MWSTPIPAWRRRSSATGERIDRRHAGQVRPQILVPTEEVVELKNGKKRRHRAPLLPGLRAGRDGDGRRHLAPGEAHQQGHRFRRRREEPPGADLREAEVMKIIHQMQEGVEKPRPKVLWSKWAKWCASRKARSPTSTARRGSQLRQVQGARLGHHLRPRHAGRAGLRAGREGLTAQASFRGLRRMPPRRARGDHRAGSSCEEPGRECREPSLPALELERSHSWQRRSSASSSCRSRPARPTRRRPIGPALGQRGLNIMEFCKAFNAQTQGMEPGLPMLPVVITAFATSLHLRHEDARRRRC